MYRTTLPPALAALLTIVGVLPGCGGDSHGPVSGSAALEHAGEIVSMSPRRPGSAGIRRVAAYIESQLQAIDPSLELQRQRFQKPAIAPGIDFENLWVEIPGREPGGPILALGAHYDSKITHSGEQDFQFLGALDAAASCGVLLELARHLHESKPIAPTVWLLWFDGEESIEWEWNDAKALIGSRHFVETMHADAARFPDGLSKRMRVFVLLDLLGDRVLKIDRDTASNPKLLDIFGATANEMGVGDLMYASQSPMQDDHLPFKSKGVRVIDLIDFRYRSPAEHGPQMPEEGARYFPWWHTAEDTMEHVSADSLEVVGNLVWRALPRIEAEFYR